MSKASGPLSLKIVVPAIPSAPTYACTGGQIKLFDDSNAQGVQSRGTPPRFSTRGREYCLSSITTYHWNDGRGATPGTIGLRVVSGMGGARNTLGPLSATGSGGQAGAPNVNWTAVAGQPIVIDGTYACQDSDPATWSENRASGGRGFCTVYVTRAVATRPPRPAKPTYVCSGPQANIFDDSNPEGVQNGGRPPIFTTYGTPGISAYCLNSITTYHFNGGLGSRPGTIALGPLNFGAVMFPIGPRAATGSSGQGGAPNVNWRVDYPARPTPTVISGAYYCKDSDPATWSQNQASGGHGFCTVEATPAFVSGFTLPSGISLPQPAPRTGSTGGRPPSKGRIRCFTGTLSSMLLYPIHVAPDGWGLLLLHCNIKRREGFQGRLTPSSVFVIDRGCGPFWTYPPAWGNPPPPVFLRYTGQPGAPCSTAQIFIPFAVTGPWRLDLQARDLATQTPFRPGAYTVFVRYPGGDVAAQNTLNVP